MKNNTTKKEHTFQFKVPPPLWVKLRVKSLKEGKTCNDTLIDLVKRHVQK